MNSTRFNYGELANKKSKVIVINLFIRKTFFRVNHFFNSCLQKQFVSLKMSRSPGEREAPKFVCLLLLLTLLSMHK